MYCSKCGNQLNDEAVVCPKCGCISNQDAYNRAFNYSAQTSYNDTPQYTDEPNPGLSLLAFLIPLFGIIYYFCEHKKTPFASQRYLTWSIISILLTIIFGIVFGITAAFFAIDFADDFLNAFNVFQQKMSDFLIKAV